MIRERVSANTGVVVSGTFVVLAGVLFAFALVWRSADQRRIDRLAVETHQALCAFKRDLAGRANQTELFISEIHAGDRDPIPGISIADLQRSLVSQRATLMSLVILDCTKKEE